MSGSSGIRLCGLLLLLLLNGIVQAQVPIPADAFYPSSVATMAATDTRLNLASASYTASESAGTASLCINISNPSPTVPTTAQLVKITTAGTHIGTTTYPITFPAGSSAAQCVSIALSENTTCNDTSSYTFELQAVSGGIAAAAGTINQTVLTVNDNDASTGVFRKLDFEGCTNWGYAGTTGTAIRSDASRYNGSASMSIRNGGSITTQNIDLAGYSNVTLSVAYAATGVDADDDLYMDLSYDNGATWTGTGSLKLFDGANNASLNINATSNPSLPANSGSVTSNPYIFNLPNGTAQVSVRFRVNSTAQSGEYYYIDDIILSGNGCAVAPAYSIATVTNASTHYINEVYFQGINAVQNLSSGYAASGYQDWTSHSKMIQTQGEPVNVSLSANTPVRWKAWVDWNKDGVFNAATEQVYSNGNYTGQFAEFGFLIPLATVPGDYRIRFRAGSTSSFTACGNVGNGEAEDYLFTVIPSCSALITGITNGGTCGAGPVGLKVTASGNPIQYRWYAAETGGSPLATTSTPEWTTPSISTTTTYYVTAYNGCESNTRTAIVATISPLPVLYFNNPAPEVCGESSVIELTVSGDRQEVLLFEEAFNNGLGLFENINSDSNNATFDALTGWTSKTSTHLPNGALWTPAISSGIGGNKFAFATSDILPSTAPSGIENSLTLISGVNTTGFLNLTLTLRVFYSRYLNDGNSTYSGTYYRDDLKVEVHDGTSWTTLATYDHDLGIGNKFATLSFSLPSSYLNITQLKVRVRHYSSSSSTLYFPGGVAVDDIKLYGEKGLNTAFGWSTVPEIDAYVDAACTAPYHPLLDQAATIYLKATEAQLTNPSFTVTANAELSNGCTATDAVTITNYAKLWTGALSNDWFLAGNWSPPGIPDASQCIIVNAVDALVIPMLQNAFGKNLIVKPAGSLTISSGANLTITDEITIADNDTAANFDDDGKLIILDGGSLIQITDVENATANNNTGSIKMHRYTQPLYRYDFTYWSSPVSGTTLHDLSPTTLFDKYFKWNDAWVAIPNGAESMTAGTGYIVRAPQNYPIEGATGNPAPIVYQGGVFTGKPNNGTVEHNIIGGTDKWNLLGNPYPSSISGEAFLNANSTHPGNTNDILGGTLYFWTHNTSIVPIEADSQIYTYNSGDYAAWNSSGRTATSANPGGSGDGFINSTAPSGYIAAGQAFFVAGNASGEAIFNNTMRIAGNNDQFFRPGQPEPIDNWEMKGKHRVWLNMKGQTKGFNQLLVGYAEGATNDLDTRFDGEIFGGNQITFYSLLENKKLTIQGRALPFNNQDQVPLGYKSTLNGTLSISIDHYDGLFEGQDVYLEDKSLNIVHDLKASAYSFASVAGTFNERFVLRFLPSETLGNPDHANIANGVILYQENGKIMIKSQLEALEQVTVYDLLGRNIFDKANIGQNEFGIHNMVMNEQPLIVKIRLANGQVVNKKSVY